MNLREEWITFLLALQFMTRLPLGDPGWTAERMAATPRYYPVVGLVLGAFTGGVYWCAALVLPPVVAILVSVAVGLLLTGAFHEDGLADFCDGLGGGATRQRALEIMKDSRIGSYGAIGLLIVLSLKVSLLAALQISLVPIVLLAGHTLSRSSAVIAMATSQYAREEGTGSAVSKGVTGMPLVLLVSCAPLALLGVVGTFSSVLAGLLGLTLCHIGLRRVYERKLGGYTGDCLGAVQQLSEVGFYLGIVSILA